MKIPATMFMTMVIALASHTPTMAATCESLASLTLPNTTITLAVSVAAGAFVPPKPFAGPGSAPPPPPFSELPAFCRVAAEVRPVATSRIKFEVWMPSTGWNGKFAGVGHGAYAGDIRYFWMSEPLSRGYATANTDTGHEGPSTDPSFALQDPDTQIDFGYRSVHEMTVKAKEIVAAYYGRPPTLSYLDRVLNRRSARAHGGPALPGRLRRDHSGRTLEQHDP